MTSAEQSEIHRLERIGRAPKVGGWIALKCAACQAEYFVNRWAQSQYTIQQTDNDKHIYARLDDAHQAAELHHLQQIGNPPAEEQPTLPWDVITEQVTLQTWLKMYHTIINNTSGCNDEDINLIRIRTWRQLANAAEHQAQLEIQVAGHRPAAARPTLAAIGQAAGMTRQRVHQIVNGPELHPRGPRPVDKS